MDEFDNDTVGGKALNTAALTAKLPPFVRVPPSAAIPYGAFERVCKEPANRTLAQALTKLQRSVGGSKDAADIEGKAYDLIMQVRIPSAVYVPVLCRLCLVSCEVGLGSKCAQTIVASVWLLCCGYWCRCRSEIKYRNNPGFWNPLTVSSDESSPCNDCLSDRRRQERSGAAS